MKIIIIQNPKSNVGNSRKFELILKNKFSNSVVEFMKTAYPGHAIAIARRATREKVDTIVAVGGDGTVNEVLNGIVGSDVAMGIIPTGTANDLASYYRLPRNIENACDIILQRRILRADLILVNNRYFITAGGLGFPSEVASIVNRFKSRSRAGILLGQILASKLYIFASFLAIFKEHHQNLLKVCWNGSSLTSDTLSLTINNQPFLGKNFVISPDAVNDDGIFDVCLIENSKTRAGILSILIKVLVGKHIYSSSVKMWRTATLIVETDIPKSFLIDGELLQKSKIFKIKILPHALNMIVPETWS